MTYRGYRIECVRMDFYRAFNEANDRLLTTGVTEQQVCRSIDAFLGPDVTVPPNRRTQQKEGTECQAT